MSRQYQILRSEEWMRPPAEAVLTTLLVFGGLIIAGLAIRWQAIFSNLVPPDWPTGPEYVGAAAACSLLAGAARLILYRGPTRPPESFPDGGPSPVPVPSRPPGGHGRRLRHATAKAAAARPAARAAQLRQGRASAASTY